jgi:2-oxoglutarate dehydrogenase E2 component (dihydrolipoamide succinyltransferase)
MIEHAGSTLYIRRWFKRVGDPVSADEPLVEIDTDNVTHEIRSPVTGVLSSIAVSNGGSVDAGTVVGSISQFLSSGPTEELSDDVGIRISKPSSHCLIDWLSFASHPASLRT